MNKYVVFIILILLTVLAGSAYFLVSPDMFKKSAPVPVTPTPATQTKLQPNPKAKNAIEAIKTYAAMQFNTTPEKIVIVKSEKQQWSNICLDIKIPNYDCSKAKLSGSEATVKAGGYETIYRSTDDGSIIRIVKK